MAMAEIPNKHLLNTNLESCR